MFPTDGTVFAGFPGMRHQADNQLPEPACVLLAEDDVELRFILARLLRNEGYHVEEIGDIEALSRRLTENPSAPARGREVQIVVTDVYMPGGTALDLVESLEGRLNGLPMIFITSAPDPDLVQRAQSVGVLAVLSKPIDMVVLKRFIREAV